jgi:hypothetical protein
VKFLLIEFCINVMLVQQAPLKDDRPRHKNRADEEIPFVQASDLPPAQMANMMVKPWPILKSALKQSKPDDSANRVQDTSRGGHYPESSAPNTDNVDIGSKRKRESGVARNRSKSDAEVSKDVRGPKKQKTGKIAEVEKRVGMPEGHLSGGKCMAQPGASSKRTETGGDIGEMSKPPDQMPSQANYTTAIPETPRRSGRARRAPMPVDVDVMTPDRKGKSRKSRGESLSPRKKKS